MSILDRVLDGIDSLRGRPTGPTYVDTVDIDPRTGRWVARRIQVPDDAIIAYDINGRVYVNGRRV
jgi:hypothetical protein